MRLRRTTPSSAPPAPGHRRGRRGLRAAVTALLIGGLPTLTAAAVPTAPGAPSPAAVSFVPHSSTARLHPGPPVANATSTNWGGYAAASGTYTSVSSTWTEPSASCGSTASYASFWTGLDGYASSSVEQTGTMVECSGGVAYQYSWYEMYPANPVYFSNTLRAGDVMTATVSATSSGAFTLYLRDATQGWSHTINQTNSSLARASAEVIAEAPYSGGVLPLADFGTVNFSNSTVNGGTLGAANPTPITMVTSTGVVKASVSGISGGTAFSMTWHHS